MTQWQPLERFKDAAVPKLFELGRAAKAGLKVPPTWWATATSLRAAPHTTLPTPLQNQNIILRSGSPDEDTQETSNAGQLHSEAVMAGQSMEGALRRVLEALPEGGPAVVFVQPLVEAERSGVAFFDGFYYERSQTEGLNHEITAGTQRGETAFGHLQRGQPWSQWLERLRAVYLEGSSRWRAVDVEFAVVGGQHVLLQARPALFDVSQKGQTLSLANHREILGDWPSPWIVSVLVEASTQVLSYFASVDPSIASWSTSYAVEVAERAWMNFGFFFRLMDHWGLPRSFVTEGVGGESGSALDQKADLGRMVRKSPRLVALQLQNLWTIARAGKALAALDAQIEAATDLPSLFEANVAAMATAIRTNFAINGALTGIARVRGWLGIKGHARVVTQDMMEDYEAMAGLEGGALEGALDDWLTRYGHRGPLESDPRQPRFAELRAELLTDLSSRKEGSALPDGGGKRTSLGLLAPFYVVDVRREWFRDQLMVRWKPLRTRILAEAATAVEAGWLDDPEDVFWLGRDALEGAPDQWRAAIEAKRGAKARLQTVELPTTATRQDIEHHVQQAHRAGLGVTERGRHIDGIALSPDVVEGVVLKADDLRQTMANPQRLGPQTILVVPALEPSWALLFPRVGGVVADLGGELSHASILLREARRPALVNCRGSWQRLEDGMKVRLDGQAGCLHILDDGAESQR